jgi:hypothetical protein
MIMMYHNLVQIEDPSDDPRAYQQHAPRGDLDDEMTPNISGLLGAHSFMHTVRPYMEGNAHSCLDGKSSTSLSHLPS